MYNYYSTKSPFHKCRHCGRKIRRNDRKTVVKTSYDGYGTYIDSWFCDKECARAEYVRSQAQDLDSEELNRYIMEDLYGV